jgi:hypothetical protein
VVTKKIAKYSANVKQHAEMNAGMLEFRILEYKDEHRTLNKEATSCKPQATSEKQIIEPPRLNPLRFSFGISQGKQRRTGRKGFFMLRIGTGDS